MGQNLGKSPSLVSMSTLSSIPPRSKCLMISPTLRTTAVTFPRQLAPTVGPALAGIEILGGSLQGMKGFVFGRITRSRSGKFQVDNSTCGPSAAPIGPGYQVSIGSINLFIGKPGEHEQETTQEDPPERASRPDTSPHHVFIGF